MLAFGIRYLNGFVAATEPDSRERVEWPPHPGRVFMALTAAHFQTGSEPSERAALLWLEELDQAPAIRASGCGERAFVTHYVPVNDKAGPSKALLQSAPLTRDRQPRSFASAHLESEIVYLTWPLVDPPARIHKALEALCSKVTRIGHSSSLVQMWIVSDAELDAPNWIPDESSATLRLRVSGPGTLADLERRYNREAVDVVNDLEVAAADDTDKKAQKAARKRLSEEFPNGAARLRPQLSAFQGYAPALSTAEGAASVTGTMFSPHPVVLTLERADGPYRHLDLASVLNVVERWREAILTQTNGLSDRVRAILSGHDREGTPLDGPHLSFLPLAFAGPYEHADGRLLGMGLTLPNDVSPDDRRESLRAIGKVRHLALGRLGKWKIESETSASPRLNLRPQVWTAYPYGANYWSTVTPVVFDRHPKTNNRAEYQREVAAMIATACVRIGLREPRDVIVTQVSGHHGVPLSSTFPRLRRKDGSERRQTHAIIKFDKPVFGPILIGAGRYRGYGFCRPLHSECRSETRREETAE